MDIEEEFDDACVPMEIESTDIPVMNKMVAYPYSCANKRGRTWTEAEDHLLSYLVTTEGTNKWANICHMMNAQLQTD
jgi:hypothetical protein